MQTKLAIPDELARLIGPARFAVEIGLVVILAIVVARVAWLMAAPQTAVAVLDERPLPSPVASAEQAIIADRSLLVKLNPYQSTAIELAPDAPETQLNLRLSGVIMSTGDFSGSAQITTPDNVTSRYTMGGDVIPGVVLERILSDRVILSRNGESETLMLGGRGEGLSVIGDGSQVIELAPADDNPAPEPATETRAISPDALLRAVSPVPMQRDGGIYGYRLTSNGPDDEMRAAGLIPNDVLLEINGTSVTQLDVNGIISEIGVNQVAVLVVERDGMRQTVRLRFEE